MKKIACDIIINRAGDNKSESNRVWNNMTDIIKLQYDQKIITADEAADMVKSGDKII